MLSGLLLTLNILVCIALVGVVLLQRSEGGVLGGGSGPTGIITTRGAGDLLTRTTWILFALFLGLSLTLTIIGGQERSSQAIIKRLKTQSINPDAPPTSSTTPATTTAPSATTPSPLLAPGPQIPSAAPTPAIPVPSAAPAAVAPAAGAHAPAAHTAPPQHAAAAPPVIQVPPPKPNPAPLAVPPPALPSTAAPSSSPAPKADSEAPVSTTHP